MYFKNESKKEDLLWDISTWIEVLLRENFIIESVANRGKELREYYKKLLWDGNDHNLENVLPDNCSLKDIGCFSLIGKKGG